MDRKTVVIVGGGAAGFFCAANIRHPNVRVIILEKTQKLLSKVRVSGGGRCNVTNASAEVIGEFAAAYPRGKNLLKKTLHRFSWKDTITWFEQRGVPLKVEADGRVFPQSDNSESIIECLMRSCEENQVEIRTGIAVQDINKEGTHISLQTSAGLFQADAVVLATGGYATALQYQWLRCLDTKIEQPVPSLFTFNLPGHPIRSLMGVSVPMAKVNISGTKVESQGPILITHWGLSGPAILRASAWGARALAEGSWNFQARINWIAAEYTEQKLQENFQQIKSQQRNQLMHQRNPFGLPARLWKYLLLEAEIQETQRWDSLPAKAGRRLVSGLTASLFDIKGKTTFKEEFVTAGGVALPGIDAQTMRLRSWPQHAIYAIGEVTDVDGITGGYNFQNAWTSGYIAAKDILRSIDN